MVHGWRLATFRPLGLSMFGGPGKLLEAGLHGPGSGASSLTYPLPSTLAGALAKALAGDPSCEGRLTGFTGDFDDLECVLQEVLGRDYRLRAGLARSHDGRLYAYVGDGLVDLEKVTEYIKKKLNGDPVEDLVYRPRRIGYTGIALKRKNKTADEGKIYHVELVDYGSPERLEIILPFQGKAESLKLEYVKLGGEGSTARVEIEDPGIEPVSKLCMGAGGVFRLLLVSPALLEPPEGGQVEYIAGGTVSSGEKLAKWLAYRLLDGARPACGKFRLSRMIVPSNDLELSIVYPGWTFLGMPRRPHIIVPAGTVIEVDVERPAQCCEKLVVDGVGVHSELGWGSVVVVPKG